MQFLILSIISSTLIGILFKSIARKDIDLLEVIVINYFAAFFLGIVLQLQDLDIQYGNWIWLAVFMGALFIFAFYLMGFITQRIGISVMVISAKMSLVIPVLYSLIYFNEKIGVLKITGIILAILAVALAAYTKIDKKADNKYLYLPVLLFFTIGIADSIIKLAQYKYIPAGNVSIFSAACFAMAAILGVILLISRKKSALSVFKPKTLAFGLVLGIVNFASLYYFILALDKSKLDSSVVYGVNNVGIISVSVIAALILFHEKLKWWNWIGIGLAVIAIYILV